MRFMLKAAGSPRTLAVVSGAFHPLTKAHLALASAALESGAADEALLVLPERFPHKLYGPVGLDQRLEMLQLAVEGNPAYSIGISDGGLFLEIARECREAYGSHVRVRFACGRDAAERIVAWDYGELPGIEEQLREYELLVAARAGGYVAPLHLREAIAPLTLSGSWDEVSSTEVRERIARQQDWRHLVPEPIHHLVAEWYG